MKNRISFAIFLLLVHLSAWAQIGGDYNPNNPSDLGNPTQEYTLTLKASPSNGGTFNTTSTNIAGGKTYKLRAYPSTDFVFVAWICNGDTLSKSSSYIYTMPYHDVEITGAFIYSPSNPSDPQEQAQKYTLTLKATPTEGGSFNTSSSRVFVGERYNLRAYPNTDFAFVAWLCEGDTLSKVASYDYTMPSHNVDITGVFTYRPSSPSDPQEQVLKYQLSLVAEPINSGSFNISNERLAVGSNNSLRAYSKTDFVFRCWTMGDSVLSTNPNMDFVMPSHNVQIVGHFEYNPASPANPNANYWNKLTGEVIVDDFTAGYLSSAISSVISGSSSNDVQMITVSGRINSNDFGVANNYKNCSLLDLSRVTGVTEVPSYAFDYTNLETVYLPATIEKIGARAFAECMKLSSLTIYAMTPPTLENNVFQGVPEDLVVYVPAAAIAQYQDVEAWGKFTLLPIQEGIRSISISLPEGANAADYAQMWLELTNTKSGQRMHYVMTDRQTYTFANIIRNTSWNVTLRNERGDIFGQIDNVEVKDEDVSVSFSSLSKPQTVVLSVLTPNGEDVTDQMQVTWTDSKGNYLAQSVSLTGLPVGYQATYRIVLSQELAMAYNTPQPVEYILTDGNNSITCQLTAIPQVRISGKVKDASTGLPLSGAVISASQTFGGKYSKTLNAKSDGNGVFTLEISNVPTSVAFAATDYVSQTINCDSLLTGSREVTLPDVSLKTITGATITLDFTYTSCEGETQNWYSDYQNVSYELFNVTKNKAISQYNVQYPQIVLLEEVEDGDVLRLTATSRTNAFMPVEATAAIAEQKAEATFSIVELGQIRSTFTKTGNASVVGSLYDTAGKLVKTYDYANASLTINNLADGNYTLVTMGNSRLFNTIYDLAQLPQTGLVEGSDYVLNTVEVKSGQVSTINISEVPTLNESKLYYTGDNTSFTVNKPSIVAGNYLTLTGRIDFKPAYATSVSYVQMIVDLPESCEFVENSVMVGNTMSSYTINGNQITIPMGRYTDRVRFCIIPTLGGEYAPSAFVQFDLDGETVTQPIGSANYITKDLSISVPSTVAKTAIPVSGTAIGASNIEIYDNGVLIGQTTSMANGTWATTCELNNSYNLSRHQIYAKVTTKQGVKLTTENASCVYDMNAIQISKVTMINTAHPSNSLELCEYVTVFDFMNPKSNIPAYWYWPLYPQFTFIVDFTNNDPTKVSEVVLYVHTNASQIVELRPEYDEKLDKWVAFHDFPSNNLPANVSLDFVAKSDVLGDSEQAKDAIEQCDDALAEDNLLRDLLDEIKSSNYSSESLFDKLFDYLNVSDEQQEDIPDNISSFLDEIIHSNNCSEFEYASGVMKIRDEEGNIITAKNTTLAEGDLTMDDLKDFYLVPLTDGSNIYLQTNGDLVDVVYNGRVFSFGISNDMNTEMAKMTRAISSDEYFTRWSQFKATLDGLNYLSKKNTIIANIKDFLLGGLNKLKTQLHQCREIKYAYAAGRLTPQQLKELDVNKLEDCLSNLPIQIQKVEHSIARLNALFKLIDIASVINDINKAIESRRNWNEIINNIESVDCWEMVDLSTKAKSHRQAVAIGYTTNIAINVATCVGADKLLGFVAMASGALGATVSSLSMATMMEICGIISAAVTDFVIIQGGINEWNDIRWQADIRLKIPVLKGKCNDDDDDGDGGNGDGGNGENNGNGGSHHSGNGDVPHVMDPSGYVYEAISSNRIEGVRATAYYKEMVEDMYGDLHENIVKWDATEYAQTNPLFTDEYGMYAWDVPNGLWQVKFEKEGYETTYSEWLPVPPPQLDINIAMKQNRQPEVKTARAYEDAVEVEFDKYMMPELLTAENIIVMQNGTAVEGTVELLNEEVSYEGKAETFASKLRFNAAQSFTEQEIMLIVNNRVKSYAGIRMQDNYQQTFAVEQEVKQIVCDSIVTVGYGETSKLVVSVLPASASKGKTLNVKTSSPMILSVDTELVTIGDDGKAEITVCGELPGTAALTFSVDGMDKVAMTIANVEQAVNKNTATPKANIVSGTVVEKGTAVTLSCDTEGADIYYTLDGSCPCDESALLYDGSPIIINEDTELRAMAVAEGYYESEIVVYHYYVSVPGATANPVASISSGSTVEKGAAITLSCDTEDASIYYTLDGTSPSVDAALLYDGSPIIINEDTELRAMAVAEGYYESEIVIYRYYVSVPEETFEVTIYKKWDDVLICDNSSNMLVAYQWYKNDAPIAGETKQFYSEAGGLNGRYYVMAQVADGGWGKSNVMICGIAAAKLKVNPTILKRSEMCVVCVNVDDVQEDIFLGVFDVMGRLVKKVDMTGDTVKLHLENSGLYVVKVMGLKENIEPVKIIVVE